MKDQAKKLGLKDVRVNAAGCLDRCELGPCVVIYPEGVWYSVQNKADIDDVLNVSGHRLSTTEIESALVSHPAVAEAAVVGGPDPVTGEAINAFVILRLGNEASPELGDELRRHVATKISPIAKPKGLMFVPDLPKTRSGKIMRRLLRDIAQGRVLGDTTTLADAGVVDLIRSNTGASED